LGSSRWSRIEDLFHHAAELGLAERSAFLDRVCADDEVLRREVESLLASDLTGDSLIEAAVRQSAERLPADSRENYELIGKRIGPYSITRLIGKGGMGAVYRAIREDDFRMEVAIKVLKHGTVTEAALSRFRAERQILAGLQHPNIARLLDGGATETGLPYFAMEYVDGTPLLEYATPLSIRQRVELFRAVCSAVQYAHQKRIVHRDIKPSNILVTRDGIPKLLDFGIAKLLDPAGGSTAITSAGARVMTPDYASPEQVRGEPVTTASDVYSLGAVLYELLTGQRARHVKTYSPAELGL
jgi:serine/threonine protein kinase